MRTSKRAPPPEPVMYSTFLEQVEAGQVRAVLFQEGTGKLYFDMKVEEFNQPSTSGSVPGSIEGLQEGTSSVAGEEPASTSGAKLVPAVRGEATRVVAAAPMVHPSQYMTRRVMGEGSILPLLQEKGVEFLSAPQPPSAAAKGLVTTLFALWVPLVPLYLLFRNAMGGGDKKTRRRRKGPSVTFSDVAGVDAAKVELMEVVRFLKSPGAFTAVGARLPRGVLLSGPPGTGKTLLAKAVAGEAGLPFFAASASEFVEMFVGRGAARVRELFREARRRAPAVVFIDELDAVGGKRGMSTNDERDQTLNQLLTEMDGFDSDGLVLVLAATNRPEMLDPALCRPGRFDRRVVVGPPDQAGREAVLAVHTRSMTLAGDPAALRRAVAAATPGFVGADLANLANEAALLALRQGRKQIELVDFMEAIDRALNGVGSGKGGGRATQRRLANWLSGLGKGKSKDGGDDSGGYVPRTAQMM